MDSNNSASAQAETFDHKAYAKQLVRTFARKGGYERFKEDWIIQVAKDRKFRGSEVALATILIKHLNRKDGYAFPPITHNEKGLAVLAGMTARTVMRLTRHLEDAGHLFVFRKRVGNKNEVNKYFFVLPSMSLGSDNKCHEGSDKAVTRVVTPDVTRVVTTDVTQTSYLTSNSTPELTPDSTLTPRSAASASADVRGTGSGGRAPEPNDGMSEAYCLKTSKQILGDEWHDDIQRAIDWVDDNKAVLSAIRKGREAGKDPADILNELVA